VSTQCAGGPESEGGGSLAGHMAMHDACRSVVSFTYLLCIMHSLDWRLTMVIQC